MNHPKYPTPERELPGSVYIPDLDDWAPDDRMALAELLTEMQEGKCPWCGLLLEGTVDVHEAIVTKGQTTSWPESWKFLINNLYNCFVVHRQCHRHGFRQQWWDYKCEIFGREEMEKWYYSLPFKNPLRRFASTAKRDR